MQYMAEVEYYGIELERIAERNKHAVDHVDCPQYVYNPPKNWTRWYVLDVNNDFYIRAYKLPPTSNPIVEVKYCCWIETSLFR